MRSMSRWIVATTMLLGALPAVAHAADCSALLPLFQQGGSNQQISQFTGLAFADVDLCRLQLSRPVYVGPAGAPPMNAVGPAPVGAAGRPPFNAAGPPPMGAAGAPPIGHTVRPLQ